jgi:phosphomannomutase/phosphoglucomutase
MNTDVFREYDVRGVVDVDLNPDFVFNLGRAIGTYAADRGVRQMSLGRDCRLSSECYAQAIRTGLNATGIDVIDIGLCATPMLYYAIRKFETGGGVMITGSHNPPEFNGFKICVGPDTIYGDEIQTLRKIMESDRYAQGAGRYDQDDIYPSYSDHLFHAVEINQPLNVVIDGGSGVGGFFTLPLLKRFGCRTTGIYCDPDGLFPHHFPDPTIVENLADLRALVLEKKAACGMAYDGDADRLGVISDGGDILWGDELLLLFSRFVLRENPGAAIIGEVKCSQTLYDDIARHGGRPIMWKAGHSLIKGKMKQEHALLAGEMSGHFFFADRYFGYDDAIYASLRLLEILSKTGKSLSELMADVPRTFTTPEIRVDCPDALKFKIVDALKDYFRRDYPIIDIDGVRIPFGDGWGLIRSSNTQPVLVLRFEAYTPERLNQIKSNVEQVLRNTMKQMS